MNVEALISERLELALARLVLDPSYRDMLLSVGQGYLKAQVEHYKVCMPPIHIPFLCCEANNGDPKRAVGVTAAWFLLQVAAHLLDKVEDQELELIGLPLRNQGVSTNLSTGLIFVAEWILNHLELDCVDPGAAWDIQREFQETVLSVCSGQHLDLSLTSPDLPTCWKIAEAKSGSAFALACYVGTRVATSNSRQLETLGNFGRHLGTIVQISDDLKDLEHDLSCSKRETDFSPLVGAFFSHIGEKVRGPIEVQLLRTPSDDLTRNSLVLYLRLEAMKYAELARKEINALALARGPKDGILAILHHLSWLGVSAN
jgi:hypothetical protein